MRFAMPKHVPPGLWRRVPPAVFSPILGLLGLALAWRAGLGGFALPMGLSGLLDGAAVSLFLFAALAYAIKLCRRPAVLVEEFQVLPGRAGVFAAALGIYLLSGILSVYLMGLAKALLVVGLITHVGFLTVLIGVFIAGPAPLRRVTPIWHLNFVGFIIAARIAPLLGWDAWSPILFWPSLIMVMIVWGVSLRQAMAEHVPAPLRPLLVMHLAPVALFGTVSALMGWVQVATLAVVVGGLGFALVAMTSRWVLAAGFSPLWGALTFPIAAYAGLCWTLYDLAPSEMLRIYAGLILIVATFVVIPITFLVQRDWARGRLAVKTNAAIA